MTFLGPDPADPNKILVKKVFRTNENSYFYEDVRLDVKSKTAHSQAHILTHDLKEELDEKELDIRRSYRKNYNIVGFSLFWKPLDAGKNHLSIIELTNETPTETWSLWKNTWLAKRDAFHYLKSRWFAH